jgi:hypothetical protein
MGNLRPGNANPNGGFFQFQLRQNKGVAAEIVARYVICATSSAHGVSMLLIGAINLCSASPFFVPGRIFHLFV